MEIDIIETKLKNAFESNSEVKLLEVLKQYPILFYELYSRHFGPCPCFCEVSFGGELRCDFCWLNDNSDGPEWVLVEIEKPRMKCFTQKGEPTSDLNHAIEQVKSWDRYFSKNPLEKTRIFGAVKKFRYIVIAGSKEEWATKHAAEWRADNNTKMNYEIRSSDVFLRVPETIESVKDTFTLTQVYPPSELKKFVEGNTYLQTMKSLLN